MDARGRARGAARPPRTPRDAEAHRGRTRPGAHGRCSNGLIHDYASSLGLIRVPTIDVLRYAAAHSALCAVPVPLRLGFMDAQMGPSGSSLAVALWEGHMSRTLKVRQSAQVGCALVSVRGAQQCSSPPGYDTSDPTPARALPRRCFSGAGPHTRDDRRHGTGLRPQAPRRGTSRRRRLMSIGWVGQRRPGLQPGGGRA